jgi:hypothetical protein
MPLAIPMSNVFSFDHNEEKIDPGVAPLAGLRRHGMPLAIPVSTGFSLKTQGG